MWPTFDQDLSCPAGAILTKMDGDSRGGAALSVNAVSGKPIKFVGMGEKLEALEPFYPDRTASRILGETVALRASNADNLLPQGLGLGALPPSRRVLGGVGASQTVDILPLACRLG